MPAASFQLADDLPQPLELLGGELFPPQQGREQLVGRAVIDLVAEVVPDGVRNGVPEAGAKSDSEERTEWVEDARGAGGAGDKDK